MLHLENQYDKIFRYACSLFGTLSVGCCTLRGGDHAAVRHHTKCTCGDLWTSGISDRGSVRGSSGSLPVAADDLELQAERDSDEYWICKLPTDPFCRQIIHELAGCTCDLYSHCCCGICDGRAELPETAGRQLMPERSVDALLSHEDAY